MATQIFVNLPVKNLDKSIAFFTSLGFKFNPQFTDQNATCMIVGDDSFIMLLAEPFFKTFIKKEITDSSKSAEVIVAISLESRQKVDEMITKAMTSGAKESNDTQDQGWMYSRSFQDPDGHLWEVFYMDPAGMNKG